MKHSRINFVASAILVFLVCGWGSRVHAQAPQDPFETPYTFSARVSVQGESDEAILMQAKSFITRELRELSGVTVTDDSPNWIFYVGAYPIKKDETRMGFVLGDVVLQTFDKASTLSAMKVIAQMKTEWPDYAQAWMSDLVVYKYFELHSGPEDDLKKTCEEIVARFDTKILEPERQEMQRLRDYNKARGKEKSKSP